VGVLPHAPEGGGGGGGGSAPGAGGGAGRGGGAGGGGGPVHSGEISGARARAGTGRFGRGAGLAWCNEHKASATRATQPGRWQRAESVSWASRERGASAAQRERGASAAQDGASGRGGQRVRVPDRAACSGRLSCSRQKCVCVRQRPVGEGEGWAAAVSDTLPVPPSALWGLLSSPSAGRIAENTHRRERVDHQLQQRQGRRAVASGCWGFECG